MRPTDLDHLEWPAAPTVSPDGQHVVHAASRIDLDGDAYRSDLWVSPSDGSEPPRRLTRGPRDMAPSYSPDGRWIAFLRATDDGPPQLHALPADGGEPWQLSEHPLGASAPDWSPDSTRIAYVARVPEEGRYGTDEHVPPAKEPPRRVTTLKYRIDDLGFTIDRRAHVFVVGLDDAEPTQLTDGDFDHHSPVWSPDGREVAFVSARHDDRDTTTTSDVFVAAADGESVRQVTDNSLPVAPRLAFSPDGATLYFAAQGEPDLVGRSSGIFAVSAAGGVPPQRLTDEEEVQVGQHPLLADEDGVTAVNLHRGAAELVHCPADGSPPQELLGGRLQVQGYARDGGTHAAVVTDATSAGELLAWRDGDGNPKTLTNHGAALRAAADLRPMTEIHTTADDGYPVHGWVVKPAGEGPFPTLLCIHGGPHSQYGYELFDEAQVYAGAGYAVVLGNPRGSSGYGEAHGRAVVGSFGGPDRADLTALLDAALGDPALDPERTAVMGGSYGGFMSAWMIAHTDRFRTAIVERGLYAPDSFLGSSDIGSFFLDLYLGTDPEQVAAQSPLAKADGIGTPTLIIHSEQDWRCPVEQAQRLYVTLKRNDVDCELLLFPGEGHELSRSGLPSHRVARFDAILEWLGRYLS